MATLSEIKNRLNVELKDSDNITFTDAEKTEALTRAIEDPAVCKIQEDASLAFINGQRSYTYPESVRGVYRVELDVNSDSLPLELSGDSYDFTDGKLTFDNRCARSISSGVTIHAWVVRKCAVGDSDFPATLVPYILNMAIYYTTELLQSTKVNRFLKNDVSMGEIIQRGQTAQREASRLKKSLPIYKFVRA